MSEIVLQGTYADFKIVKTRGCAQMVIEVPLERASKIIEGFGLPAPGEEVPVAVARLHDSAPAPDGSGGEPSIPSSAARPGGDSIVGGQAERSPISLAQMAGILAKDPAFQKWALMDNADQAAVHIRLYCGVDSRSEIKEGTGAAYLFHQLKGSFEAETRYGELVR